MMINWNLARRLVLTLATAALLLLALAYWWLNNLVHEAAGTVMFGLVARHVFLNRGWFVRLFRGSYDARRMLVTALHGGLIANMLVLLGTSLAISRSVFTVLNIPDTVTIRDLHWVAAYWLVMTVGVHLGLHWARVMSMLGSALRPALPLAVPRAALRFAAVCLAAFGLWSFSVMGIGIKLTWNYSLNFWDFTASVAPFFAHLIGVLALPAVATHYMMKLTRRRLASRR